MLRKWEDLPQEMRTEEVRPYYDLLRKKQGSLLCKRLFDILASLVLLVLLSPVFLVLAIVAVVWRTNIIPKTLTAATVNGEKYTAAEVNFYFENYYQNFLNRNYSVLSMIGLDTGSSLKDQTVSDTANSLLPAMGMPEAELPYP